MADLPAGLGPRALEPHLRDATPKPGLRVSGSGDFLPPLARNSPYREGGVVQYVLTLYIRSYTDIRKEDI